MTAGNSSDTAGKQMKNKTKIPPRTRERTVTHLYPSCRRRPAGAPERTNSPRSDG